MIIEREMPAALLSRWGLEPVVLFDGEKPSPAPAEEEEEDPDDEVTGRTLWDCTQVLWDLVADPDPQNEFTVRGKVMYANADRRGTVRFFRLLEPCFV